MTTSDEMDAESGLTTQLQTMKRAPCLVVAVIDFKHKREDAEDARRRWVQTNTPKLHQLAKALQNIATLHSHGHRSTSVLVEVINVRTCAQGNEMWRNSFEVGQGCGAPGSRYLDELHHPVRVPKSGAPCTPSNAWRNALAYEWGFARLHPCVQYGVHIDHDVVVKPSVPSEWVRKAIDRLRTNSTAFAISPVDHRLRLDVNGRNVLSTQAFVVDLKRHATMLPLIVRHPAQHIEFLLRNAATRKNYRMLHLSQAELGVHKVVVPFCAKVGLHCKQL